MIFTLVLLMSFFHIFDLTGTGFERVFMPETVRSGDLNRINFYKYIFRIQPFLGLVLLLVQPLKSFKGSHYNFGFESFFLNLIAPVEIFMFFLPYFVYLFYKKVRKSQDVFANNRSWAFSKNSFHAKFRKSNCHILLS